MSASTWCVAGRSARGQACRPDQIGPVLDVMVGVDEGKDGVVHVSVLGAASDVEKFDSTALPSGDSLPVMRGRLPASQ